jgi:AcrR family transcriptional regulator
MQKSLSPRKTPRQGRARATYDTLLQAAAHIISRSGLAMFNTNAVAERAGVSIGTLYQYFPNKDALMVALIRQQQGRQRETLKAAIGAIRSSSDLETIVRTLVRAAMQHHRDNDLLASAIDHEEARLPVDDLLSGYLDSSGALVASLLARFAGEVRPITTDQAARTLPALVRGVVDAWANLSPPQLDIAEDEAFAAVLGYLRPSTRVGR